MSDQAYLTLALVPGIGRARLEMLLAAFGSAQAALEAPPDALQRVPGISPAAATAIASADPAAAARAVGRVRAMSGAVLLPADAAFPQRLREIPDAPTYLFALGRTELLAREALAVVGSRTHTRYGGEVTRHFAAGAARAGLVVVSGMARGLDAAAHGAALDAGGDTVGILGNGLGVIYPSANRRLYERMAAEGCLVTEFPPGERPNAGSFQRRNRLISGLARTTLVTEARERSGALITANCALAQGRDVLAIPGPITSPLSRGCNRLIQEGAKPVLGLRDVLEEYGLGDAAAVTLPSDLSDAERRVLDVLSLGVEHVDELAQRMSSGVADALAVLTSLEIRGLVSQLPGKNFRVLVGLQAVDDG